MSGLVVAKIGGELVLDGSITAVATDLCALERRGYRVIVVHGGGRQATDLQKALGQEPIMVGGRRITDRATLDVMKMTVGGLVNIDVCSAFLAAGGRPVGLHGASARAIAANKRPPRVVSGGGPDPIDFGHVGDVTGTNRALLDLLCGAGYLPVLACLGADEHGAVLNINADVVANQVAQTLCAEHLLLVTSVPGVLTDVKDPRSRLQRLSVAEARAKIADGTISGGMIPKVEESLAVLGSGVGSVHIVGVPGAGDLLREITQPGSFGTALSG